MSFEAELQTLMDNYVRQVRLDFERAVSGWQADVRLREVQAVMGGLLSRQCLLGTMLVRRYDYWENLIGPLFLRAMVEVTVNMAWISIEPALRSAKFVSYGLGQSKLALEHARNLASLMEESQEAVDAQAMWLNVQRHEMFTDVNVGQWADMDLETMANQADVSKLYTLYSFLGPAAHGSWDHVFQFFLDGASEHERPIIPVPRLNPMVPYLAAQGIDEAFRFFRKVAQQPHSSGTYSSFTNGLEDLRKAG